jgi:hypothetical protein
MKKMKILNKTVNYFICIIDDIREFTENMKDLNNHSMIKDLDSQDIPANQTDDDYIIKMIKYHKEK